MKKFSLIGLSGFVLLTAASAQVVIPAHPSKFKTRSTGSGTSGGIEQTTEAPRKVRHITYIVLADTREWLSHEGTPRQGKLIAFENLVVESIQGGEAPAPPEPPAHPTVVRDGKARLMVNQKPFEVPLERLSPPDRDFIEKIRATHAKKSDSP